MTDIITDIITEYGLATEFLNKFRDRFQYVDALQRHRWLIITHNDDGTTRWRVDDTLDHLRCIREVCREAATRCDDPFTVRWLLSAETMLAVERIARTDFAVTKEKAGIGDRRRQSTTPAELATAKAAFAALLRRYAGSNRHASNRPRATDYAPREFAKEREAVEAGCTEEHLADALRELLREGQVVIGEYRTSNRKLSHELRLQELGGAS